MLFNDGIGVHLLVLGCTRTHIYPHMHERLPKRFTHTQPNRQLPIRAFACIAPIQICPQSFLSALGSITISVGYPWPPHLKSQSLQHSLSPFVSLFSYQTPIASCHISWFPYLCVIFYLIVWIVISMRGGIFLSVLLTAGFPSA